MAKMKTFFNDKDGLTIVEFIAMVFTCVYLLVAITTLLLEDSHGVKIEVLRTLTQPMLVILSGFFVNVSVEHIADNIGSKNKGKNTEESKKEIEEKYEGEFLEQETEQDIDYNSLV